MNYRLVNPMGYQRSYLATNGSATIFCNPPLMTTEASEAILMSLEQAAEVQAVIHRQGIQIFIEPVNAPVQAPASGCDIARKTAGVLVDELITTDIKCFMAQEQVMARAKCHCGARLLHYSRGSGICAAGHTADLSAAVLAELANSSTDAQTLNRRRNELIRAIDASVGQAAASPTGKTY